MPKPLKYTFLFLVLIMGLEGYGQKVGVEKRNQKNDSLSNLSFVDENYTKIVLRFCKTHGKSEYTDENTKYFELEDGYLNFFVFSSELSCGEGSGSCGFAIDVYKKKGELYEIIYSNCGNNIEKLIETNYGIHSFTYHTRRFTYFDDFLIKVYWDGNMFKEDTLKVNTMDYSPIKQIADLEKINISYIVPNYSKDSSSLYTVSLEKLKLGKDKMVDFYTINTSPCYYIFESSNLLFHTCDVHSIEWIKDNSKDYYDIKTYSNEDVVTTMDTSYIAPKVYQYSNQKKKYELKK